MEKQQSVQTVGKEILLQELREFGFLEEDIQKALQYTNSKQIAAEIIVKLMEQGPNANLSMYEIYQHQQVKQINDNKMQSEKLPEYTKPIRPKMLFVINGSLKMGKGKICAQVGHAVIGAYLQIEQQAKYDQKSAQRLISWESSGSPKIVVKAQTEEQMLEIEKKLKGLGVNTYVVEDAGHTQIKAGSRTILAIGPAFSNQIDPLTEHLKLA